MDSLPDSLKNVLHPIYRNQIKEVEVVTCKLKFDSGSEMIVVKKDYGDGKPMWQVKQ
jgi:hypothetical protein